MAGRKKGSGNSGRRRKNNSEQIIASFKDELITWAALLVAVLLLLCNFGVCGSIGNTISLVMFGLFGPLAYILPIFIFIGFVFRIANKDGGVATIKLIAGTIFVILMGIIVDLIVGGARELTKYNITTLYETGVMKKSCGVIFGSISFFVHKFLGTAGCVLLVLVLGAICFVIITEKSLLQGFRTVAHKTKESAWENEIKRRERALQERQADEERYAKAKERRRLEDERLREEELKYEQQEDEKILRMDKKVSGISLSDIVAGSKLINENKTEDISNNKNALAEVSEELENEKYNASCRDERMHEINSNDFEDESLYETVHIHSKRSGCVIPVSQSMQEITADTAFESTFEVEESVTIEAEPTFFEQETVAYESPEPESPEPERTKSERVKPKAKHNGARVFSDLDNYKAPERKQNPYKIPPIDLLKKSKSSSSKGGEGKLLEMGDRLINTLSTFGVKAHIIDVTKGPAVTRYEIQPDPGVKVSKIVGLADDIKLNLAATDIRMEAPIPGKSAVGIEVPNESSEMVSLRELIDSKEFKDEVSDKTKLSFAVGKDIGGKTVLTNIGKMPHALIAGATGSGKSVCINTLILSLLYKFSPDELKLIMVDPKVVELSVYNGIPHLMVPVVTDAKKAAASLSWAVSEMTDRYKKFADMGVRNLEGYNKKVELLKDEAMMAVHKKLPYIVIIVDEMADLMMVAAKEVEDSISRLAALARACGIHLILATQRPSVDVITGVIKANMPSRIAFAVSSAIDSRTILDVAGAEKLLGKGDMLFFPQGMPKPVRLQGAFVSDEEVEDVVNYIKVQKFYPVGQEEVEEQINKIATSQVSSSGGKSNDLEDADAKDDLFEKAGRFIIEKDKASIGNLQRAFKIGFNRAARIMDQLCDAGVVGEEEGTKPRKILMSNEQFEQYLEEYL